MLRMETNTSAVKDLESGNANGETATSVVNPPQNTEYATLPPDHPLVTALKAQKDRNATLSQEMQSVKAQMNLVTASLGEIDPNRLNQIQDAMRTQAELDTRLEQERLRAIQETEGRFTQNVSQLTASLESSQNQLVQLQRYNGLQSLFSQTGGQDFASFKALMDSRYTVEYGDSPDPWTPPPVKAIYNRADGSPVTTEEGRHLTPQEILLLLRQGKLGGQFGSIIQNTFLPYNQASGVGYSPSVGDPGKGEPNPFLAANPNMTAIGQYYKANPARALAMAKEANNPKLSGLVKSWEAAARR